MGISCFLFLLVTKAIGRSSLFRLSAVTRSPHEKAVSLENVARRHCTAAYADTLTVFATGASRGPA
ncbi:MAG TPA: hypothetical protein DCP92_06550 [Nitrospiraceae bacterium]|nr:hypothetical protein [Nitrospiraceae bacterium]